MGLLRLSILLAILGAALILVVQNPQALAIVFFGQTLPLNLSLGGWVLVFFGLGMATSGLWLVVGTSLSGPRPRKPGKFPRRDFSSPGRSPEAEKYTRFGRRKNDLLNEYPPQTDWDVEGDEDWERGPEIWDRTWEQKQASPPRDRPPTPKERATPRDRPPTPKEKPAPNPAPAPKKTDPDPGPPQAKPRNDGDSKPPVYDANYRVITPPPAPDAESDRPEGDSDGDGPDWI